MLMLLGCYIQCWVIPSSRILQNPEMTCLTCLTCFRSCCSSWVLLFKGWKYMIVTFKVVNSACNTHASICIPVQRKVCLMLLKPLQADRDEILASMFCSSATWLLFGDVKKYQWKTQHSFCKSVPAECLSHHIHTHCSYLPPHMVRSKAFTWTQIIMSPCAMCTTSSINLN